MTVQTHLQACFGFLQERTLALRFEKRVRHSIERLAEVNAKQHQRCVCEVFDRSVERRERVARVSNQIVRCAERDVAGIARERADL